MALDGITVAALAAEFQNTLVGGRIARIAQPEEDEVLLTVKTFHGQKRLVLSANPSLPLTYLTDENKPGQKIAPGFLMLLRKHLAGGRILSVTQPGLERIIRIEVEHLDEMGDLCRKVLVLELMGKHSNLIFLDGGDVIIDSVRRIPAGVSSVREVLPGRPYFVPNTRGKKAPEALTEQDFASALQGSYAPLEKAFNELFTGISPLMAREICLRSGLHGDETAGELTAEQIGRLFDVWQSLFADILAGNFSPRVYYHKGRLLEFSPLPLELYQAEEFTPYDSISAAMEAYYAEKDSSTRIRQKSAELRHILQTALERCSKKLDIQRKQLKDTEKRDKYRLWGELLQTYGYGAEPGAKSITAPNYYDNDAPVTIPLDETLSAKENAKKYFDRYQKLKRTFEATSAQLEESESEMKYLQEASQALAMAGNEEDLNGIKAELVGTGFIRSTRGKKGEKLPKAGRPLHFRSEEGIDFYVGKNNLQNEELTFSFASGNDWWFHAKGIPGSHVIVKTGGAELSDRGFEQAGALAAWFSAAPKDSKCEVDYTRRKELKKPAAYKPGLVIYHTNWSLVVTPGTDGLEQQP